MGVEPLIQLLENVVPVGVVVLVGIGLFFMRDLYERNLKYLREEMQDLKDFYNQRLTELKEDINELKEENKYFREENQKATEREVEARLNFVNLIKDFPGIHSAVQNIFQSLKNSVSTLSTEQGEDNTETIGYLTSKIEDLQASIQDIAKVDERTRKWLNQVEELSINRKNWASEAEQYAHEKARQREAMRSPKNNA